MSVHIHEDSLNLLYFTNSFHKIIFSVFSSLATWFAVDILKVLNLADAARIQDFRLKRKVCKLSFCIFTMILYVADTSKALLLAETTDQHDFCTEQYV